MYKNDGAVSDGTEHLSEETSDETECPLTGETMGVTEEEELSVLYSPLPYVNPISVMRFS